MGLMQTGQGAPPRASLSRPTATCYTVGKMSGGCVRPVPRKIFRCRKKPSRPSNEAPDAQPQCNRRDWSGPMSGPRHPSQGVLLPGWGAFIEEAGDRTRTAVGGSRRLERLSSSYPAKLPIHTHMLSKDKYQMGRAPK